VGIPHAADHRRRTRKAGGAAVDRELRFAVEDDEHLLDRVVKVVADTAPGGDLATVEEVEVGADRAPAQQPGKGHVAGAGVHRGERAIGGWIGGHDASRQGAGCAARRPQKSATKIAATAGPAWGRPKV
jgi:hypothetical protein